LKTNIGYLFETLKRPQALGPTFIPQNPSSTSQQQCYYPQNNEILLNRYGNKMIGNSRLNAQSSKIFIVTVQSNNRGE